MPGERLLNWSEVIALRKRTDRHTANRARPSPSYSETAEDCCQSRLLPCSGPFGESSPAVMQPKLE